MRKVLVALGILVLLIIWGLDIYGSRVEQRQKLGERTAQQLLKDVQIGMKPDQVLQILDQEPYCVTYSDYSGKDPIIYVKQGARLWQAPLDGPSVKTLSALPVGLGPKSFVFLTTDSECIMIAFMDGVVQAKMQTLRATAAGTFAKSGFTKDHLPDLFVGQ